jgi:hypothetical protein
MELELFPFQVSVSLMTVVSDEMEHHKGHLEMSEVFLVKANNATGK